MQFQELLTNAVIFIGCLAIADFILVTIRFFWEYFHQEESEDDLMIVNIEKGTNNYRIYNKDTEAFIVQVNDYEEMKQYFSDYYPYYNVIAHEDDLKLFGKDAESLWMPKEES